MHRIENALAKVNDLLEAADYFQMDGLKEMCGRLISDTITTENCLEVSHKGQMGQLRDKFFASFSLLHSFLVLSMPIKACRLCRKYGVR